MAQERGVLNAVEQVAARKGIPRSSVGKWFTKKDDLIKIEVEKRHKMCVLRHNPLAKYTTAENKLYAEFLERR